MTLIGRLNKKNKFLKPFFYSRISQEIITEIFRLLKGLKEKSSEENKLFFRTFMVFY